MNRSESRFIGCDAPYDAATAVLFGAPFDGTTSFRPGARFAAAAMRADSAGLETYSPYQNRDMGQISVFDAGDLELPFGSPARVVGQIEAFTRQILADGKTPAMIGGEHLVTLGAVRALAAQVPELHVIHFDAHADLREDYMGEPLSHATVLRRIWDILGDGRIHQFGIRSGERAEFAWADSGHVFQRRFDLSGTERLPDTLAGKPVYLTLDLDVLDPSVFPGTGTPEPGGVSFQALLDALLRLSGLDIRGFDIVELSPHYDASGVSTAVACKLLREMLLAFCQ